MDRVELHGRLAGTPVCTHTCAGERIYEVELIVPRDSGTEDRIMLALGEYTLARRLDVMLPGTAARVIGEIRYYRHPVEDGYRGKVMVFARELHLDMVLIGTNRVELTGTVMGHVHYRTTPFGRQISDMRMRVERGYGHVEVVPVITWGRLAQMASVLEAGEKIHCLGRMQSRSYYKKTDNGEEMRTTYEVSVHTLTPENAAEPMTEEELRIYG